MVENNHGAAVKINALRVHFIRKDRSVLDVTVLIHSVEHNDKVLRHFPTCSMDEDTSKAKIHTIEKRKFLFPS